MTLKIFINRWREKEKNNDIMDNTFIETTRWFDEDGKEIIEEPVNIEEFEHIAEIGGIFEEFSVGVYFYSVNLDREEITSLLGHSPTKAWNAGERHQVGYSKKTKMNNWGKWYLSSERDSTDLNIKLRNLFEVLTDDLDKWRTLTSKYESWVDVAGYMNNWNREFIVEADVLKLLSDRNLEICFDIYYNGEEEEDDE